MRMKIVQLGDPVLRQEARTLTKEEIRSRETQDLIAAMRETMYEAPGVGLAAPQIGLPLQLAVIEDKPEYLKDAPPAFLKERERTPVPFHVIVNPQLTVGDGEKVSFYEGCLSLAGFTAVVPRARSVRVECLDHRGEPKIIEASGWYARILQHEIDHLNGTVYIDRMHSRTFSTIDHFNAFWKDKSMAEVKRRLDWER
jgi:peptide deformylase